jgi:hypothetical protein
MNWRLMYISWHNYVVSFDNSIQLAVCKPVLFMEFTMQAENQKIIKGL